MTTTAGVDLGGTNMAVALVTAWHEVVDRRTIATPTGGPDAVAEAIAEEVGALLERPAAVGIGAPGPVHGDVLETAPNLTGFDAPTPLGRLVAAATGLPTALGNDATTGTVGEWTAGAGRGSRFLLGVWLGTGVGGGLVLDGRAYEGAHGGAGEIGHVIVRAGGAECGCGRRGCLEAYAGRRSLERAAAAAIEAGANPRLEQLRREAGKDRLTSKVWAAALADGDPLATRLIDEAIAALGVGIASAVNLLDIDRIVLGGGLADRLGPWLADRVADAARPWILADADRRVVVSELGDDAGVIGAAVLARALIDG